MKRTLIILLSALFCMTLLFSCADKKEDDKDDTNAVQDDYSEYFLTPRSEAELCYLSYFGCDSFGSYIMAYPDVAIEHIAEKEGMDYDSFVESVEAGLDKEGEKRLDLYGKEFDVGYVSILDEEIKGKELDALRDRVSEYGIDPDSITEAIRAHYNYSCFTRQEKVVSEDGTTDHQFGVIPDDAEILYQSTVEFTIIYIEDEGWYVSPEDFIC